AGKPEESRMVLFVEGKSKPFMPPQKARQPEPTEIGLLRAWIATGARDDSADVKIAIPDIKPSIPAAAPVSALAYSPDGKLLATCGYDRLIKLWEVANGQEVRTLRDHSDAIYALAFSPDGKLLASAAADRAVKVWDIASGNRLYTLGEATDWLYAVAWSPDGRTLAAGGVDKSIRVWEVSAAGGKLVHSVFAHEGPVI